MTFHMWGGSIMRVISRGRRSIWWSWRVTLVAPRIVNGVSYVRRINHEIHFSWQAQYLVKLECHFSWQAQQFVKFWEIAGARNVAFFHTKCVSKMRREILSSNRLYIGGSNSESFRWNLELKISWQGQYLVKLEGVSCCSAHCKWRCISEED